MFSVPTWLRALNNRYIGQMAMDTICPILLALY